MRHADRPVLGRHLRLDAAPGAPVAREGDLALHGDAQPLELVVVLGQAVVHVHEGAGDVAVDRVGVVRRELLGLLATGRIDRERRLLESQAEPRRLDHLDQPLLRRREEHVEGLDPRVPAPLAEAREHPLGVLLSVGGADVVRARAQPAHGLAHVVGAREGREAALPLAPALRGWGVRRRGGSGHEKQGDGETAGNAHGGRHSMRWRLWLRSGCAAPWDRFRNCPRPGRPFHSPRSTITSPRDITTAGPPRTTRPS